MREMDPLGILLIILACYSILLFFDIFFKSCAHYPYLKLLDSLGLRISFLTIKWKTKALNRLIVKWGRSHPLFWKMWFNVGVYICLLFFPIALYVLVSTILHAFFNTSSGETQLLITPVLPGVNLPLSELGYYSLALLSCSIVHELGHAITAVIEDIGVLEFGCNIYFILPIAYVSLSAEKLGSTNLKKRLIIFSAGIWHNISLSFMVYLLYCALPLIFSPLYDYETGVSISHIDRQSPLKDPSKGLFMDDMILGVNNCPVKSETDWYNCLNSYDILKPAICIKSDLVNALDESIPLRHLGNGYVECCESNNNKNLCFEYIDIENNELELPRHVCLPGRIVLEQSSNFCTTAPHFCPDNLYCFKPILPNSTFLFKIVSKGKVIIYLGHPNDLFQTIAVSSYVRKQNFLSVNVPDKLAKFTSYIVIISLGLAFVNVLPFIYMDGEYILQTLAYIILRDKIIKTQIGRVVTGVTWVSTTILVIYLLHSLIVLL